MRCCMQLAMFDMTVCLGALKRVGQIRMHVNQALPLANIYVKELLDGCGLVHIANENIIAPVEATEDIYADYVE